MVLACVLRPNILGARPLIPLDSNQEEATPLGRILDVVVPVAMAFFAYFLARQGTFWGAKSYFLAGGAVTVLAQAKPEDNPEGQVQGNVTKAHWIKTQCLSCGCINASTFQRESAIVCDD